MLQGQTGADSFSYIFSTSQVHAWLLDITPHSVTCREAGTVTWRPCLPTLLWLSDPQHGYTLDTCVETQAGVKVFEIGMLLQNELTNAGMSITVPNTQLNKAACVMSSFYMTTA